MALLKTRNIWIGARTEDGGSANVYELNGWYQAVLTGTPDGATVTLNIDGAELTDATGTANGSFTAAFNFLIHVAGEFTAVVSDAGASTSLTLVLTELRG